MKLMVIDGNSIINRAYYGIRMLTTKDGTPTNAVYGFLNILQKLIAEEQPDGLCVTFDLKGPTFRHEQYADYKAQRKPMPDELAVQMPILKDVLDAMRVPRYELQGYEADDLIGTIAAVSHDADWECVIVTGDKDDLQLVTDKVRVKLVTSRMGQTKTDDYTPEKVLEVYGFAPRRIIDLKALMGDASDNIPGVPGVGEKTAMDLVQRYGTIEDIYKDLSALDIKDGVRKKLADGGAAARMSYDLATIVCDVPFDFAPTDTERQPHDAERLRALFVKLEFLSLIPKFGLETLAPAGICVPDAPQPNPTEHITTQADLDALLTRCKTADYVSVRTLDNLDGVEIGEAKQISVVMWGAAGEGYNLFLRELFSDQVTKVGHHIKDTMRALLEEGIRAEGYIFDTALAAYLLDPTVSKYEPEKLASQYLNGPLTAETQIVYDLYPVLREKLEAEKLTKVFEQIEMPLCEVLAQMEHTGFLVDRTALKAFGDKLSGWIHNVQSEIYELAGQEFNINSPKQLGQILFDVLGLPPAKKTKTGYSTNVEVLQKLQDKHPIIPKIMDFREYSKLKSTYADGLTKTIAPDGRIHSHFQMTVTATGRLSSTEPNLQNIPVRKELGGEIRKMFVAPTGRTLVDADYSQIELRLLAHISGDETMRQAFGTGEDIHTVTASQVFDVAQEDVTPLMRSRAKAVNFGIVYGISAFSLAQDIGVSVAEAKHYIENYLAKYSGVRDYMTNIVEAAKKNGQVETLFGRIRPLPELKASDFNTRSFGERVALNMPIQGTAADIMKLAMIRVHERLEREGLAAKLVLQVHDELIVECPEAETERVTALLEEELEQVITLSVPLTAEAKSGTTWYDAK
ncbi:MAG: DNA polymerase I [Oscillospiraceae bacterium]|nr:DNA polymerase I [Oscillospiraceae bacterium]